MLEPQTSWQKYEEYTRQILNDKTVQTYLKKRFNLCNIESESGQFLGEKTKTIWHVDGYGYDINNQLILIECKHYATKEVKRRRSIERNYSKNFQDNTIDQNTVAAFAYIIKDVKAHSGIIVTTCRLQDGATKVAKAENIDLIILEYDSTDKNYFVRFDLLDKPIEAKQSETVGVLTDQVNGISGADGAMVVTDYSYLIEKAMESLKKETGKEEFSQLEVQQKMIEIRSQMGV